MTQLHHQKESKHSPESRSHQIVKAATAAMAGGSFLIISGRMLAGTVIALTMITPLMVIFSPVLFPAAIAMGVLATGFLTSGGLVVAAIGVLLWVYRYVKGRRQSGTDSLHRPSQTWVNKVQEMKAK